VAVPEDKVIEPVCPFAGSGTRRNNDPRLATAAVEAHLRRIMTNLLRMDISSAVYGYWYRHTILKKVDL
jgi:hypothetical protein